MAQPWIRSAAEALWRVCSAARQSQRRVPRRRRLGLHGLLLFARRLDQLLILFALPLALLPLLRCLLLLLRRHYLRTRTQSRVEERLRGHGSAGRVSISARKQELDFFGNERMNELSATAQRRSYTRTTNARIPEHVRAHTWPQRNSNLAMTRRHRTTFTHANSQLSVEKWPGEQRTHARTQQRAAPPPCCNCPICSAHASIYSQSTDSTPQQEPHASACPHATLQPHFTSGDPKIP